MTPFSSRSAFWRIKTGIPSALAFLLLLTLLQFAVSDAAHARPLGEPDNALCQRCHGRESFSQKLASGEQRMLHVAGEAFNTSVHGRFNCIDCHQDITDLPHRKGIDRKVGCVSCHQDSWERAQAEGVTEENARLGEVVRQIENWMGSIHARPSIADQSRTNATCYDCHDAHYVEPIDSGIGSLSRLETPDICGRCHTEIRDTYFTSVHGIEVEGGNASAAVCTDCHTSHNIENPHESSGRLVITESCGNCHEDSLETYLGTYHGKVTKLGYGGTAKCYDCHGSHDIHRVDDEASSMHVNNRLETCQTCHEDATAGYTSFEPHGHANDFASYPQIWIASKFMIGLLLGTFAFFWLHSALWYFREYQDRKHGRDRPHIKVDQLPAGRRTHFRRFPWIWRLAHLIGALSIMTLILTGTTVLYADSFWASAIIKLLGGPETAAIIHRVGAIGFITVFFAHLVFFAYRIGSNIRTFDWFGPHSLVPNWQDLLDIISMFKWFLGLDRRPNFERWTYWEKFDYWAPFWGMMIIGISGMMMWFPEVTAEWLPGWVFNVAAIVHGEEAFLATVFLFTVHFFNNHFRPDKFPQDITMFTGTVPLALYRHEHRREYDRLVASGELDKYLVSAPSKPMTRASKILGATLITVGLILLTMVLSGFLGHMMS